MIAPENSSTGSSGGMFATNVSFYLTSSQTTTRGTIDVPEKYTAAIWISMNQDYAPNTTFREYVGHVLKNSPVGLTVYMQSGEAGYKDGTITFQWGSTFQWIVSMPKHYGGSGGGHLFFF